MILHCDSMTKLLELVYFAPQPKILAASLFWLSLNIVGTILRKPPLVAGN